MHLKTSRFEIGGVFVISHDLILISLNEYTTLISRGYFLSQLPEITGREKSGQYSYYRNNKMF